MKLKDSFGVIFILLASVALFMALASVEAFEWFVEYSRDHEDWELDELALMVPTLVFTLMLLNWRQWRKRVAANMARNEETRLLAEKARYHPLTRLPTEATFMEAVAAMAPLDGTLFAVQTRIRPHLWNIDSSEAGEAALLDAIMRLKQAFDADVLLGSMDSDRLLLYFPRLSAPTLADATARRIVEVLSLARRPGIADLTIPAVCGLASTNKYIMTAPKLLRRALVAQERALIDPNQPIIPFNFDDESLRQRRIAMVNQLKLAIERHEIQCVFQPILCMRTGEVKAFEALARWHPAGGNPVPPLEFIPLIEEAGLIDAFTDQIIERSLETALSWPESINVSINVSRLQLLDDALDSRIAQALASAGLAPGRLEIEVTETVELPDRSKSYATISALRQRGIRIAIDDFGAGFSNLQILQDIEFDRIKIDRIFVKNATKSALDRAIISATVAMAHALDKSVTVEGIEDEATATVLRDLGCGHAQGYYFGRPMKALDIPAFIDEQRSRQSTGSGRLPEKPASTKGQSAPGIRASKKKGAKTLPEATTNNGALLASVS